MHTQIYSRASCTIMSSPLIRETNMLDAPSAVGFVVLLTTALSVCNGRSLISGDDDGFCPSLSLHFSHMANCFTNLNEGPKTCDIFFIVLVCCPYNR